MKRKYLAVSLLHLYRDTAKFQTSVTGKIKKATKNFQFIVNSARSQVIGLSCCCQMHRTMNITDIVQTLGRPVLPLVYMITAMLFLEGRLGRAGLLFPSFSTSENDETVQLLRLPENPESFS